MCECGCSIVNWNHKIIDSEGYAILFGVHLSCDYCECPAGVRVFRCPPEDFITYDVEYIPEFDFSRNNCSFIDVLCIYAVRKQMREGIVNYQVNHGLIDDIDADFLAEEVFENLRPACIETKKLST